MPSLITVSRGERLRIVTPKNAAPGSYYVYRSQLDDNQATVYLCVRVNEGGAILMPTDGSLDTTVSEVTTALVQVDVEISWTLSAAE